MLPRSAFCAAAMGCSGSIEAATQAVPRWLCHAAATQGLATLRLRRAVLVASCVRVRASSLPLSLLHLRHRARAPSAPLRVHYSLLRVAVRCGHSYGRGVSGTMPTGPCGCGGYAAGCGHVVSQCCDFPSTRVGVCLLDSVWVWVCVCAAARPPVVGGCGGGSDVCVLLLVAFRYR